MAPLIYERDPAEIYRLSFARIRREVDLSGLSGEQADMVIRMVHACGMTDLTGDIRFGGDVVGATRAALAAGRPVLVDTEMVRHAVLDRYLPSDVRMVCTLRDPQTPQIAAARQTTRSAASVTLWRDELCDAVVIIGNAPTALFALLEELDQGAPRPAAVFAVPVGFVGATEAKAALVADSRGVPFVTVLGRRGGSAIAGAAFNAVVIGATDR